MYKDLTNDSVFKTLVRYSVPYLISCFLQTFYGLADLFIIGQFDNAAVISAVSVGSQIMHMVTVIIAGLAMGAAVAIGTAIGAKDREKTALCIGNTVSLFLIVSAAATIISLLFINNIIHVVLTPAQSEAQTKEYLLICFAGIPFITAYNILSSIFRGMGDSKSPMYFVAISGIVNIILDYIFIGIFKLQARGAAYATVTAQAVSVAAAAIVLAKSMRDIKLKKRDFIPESKTSKSIFKVGLPIACQDGFIQISFLVITAIANMRGVNTAAAVGIVEKIICFVFLVPSAMLSSISAIAAQNAGAGLHERGKQALYYGIKICVVFGLTVSVVCQFVSEDIIQLFTKTEPAVVRLGGQYLHTYIFDCLFAGIHFCFCGYFCAYGKSLISFITNFLSVVLVRIPIAYASAIFFPDNLYPMGLASTIGSVVTALIFTIVYKRMAKTTSHHSRPAV